MKPFFVCVGLSFGLIETIYFGNNFLPGSWFEFCCDMVSVVMVFGGIFL